MTEIYKRLRAVQNELHAPKNQENTFSHYSYRSAEDIIEAVKPVLDKHDLTLIISDELQLIGERYYVCARATVHADDEGKSFSATGYAREEENKKGMDGAQITGSASSYARKYALNGLLAIDDTKDPDTNEHQTQVKKAPAKPAVGTAENGTDMITGKQTSKMLVMFKKLGISEREGRLLYTSQIIGREVGSAKELNKKEASEVIEQLVNDVGDEEKAA